MSHVWISNSWGRMQAVLVWAFGDTVVSWPCLSVYREEGRGGGNHDEVAITEQLSVLGIWGSIH